MGGRGVVCKNWWLVISVAKVMLEDVIRTRLCVGEFDGLCYFKEESWCCVIERFVLRLREI